MFRLCVSRCLIFYLHCIKRMVLSDLHVLDEDALRHVVDADILALAPSQDVQSVR